MVGPYTIPFPYRHQNDRKPVFYSVGMVFATNTRKGSTLNEGEGYEVENFEGEYAVFDHILDSTFRLDSYNLRTGAWTWWGSRRRSATAAWRR